MGYYRRAVRLEDCWERALPGLSSIYAVCIANHGLDDFLAMGLIGISYGTALLCGTYGFLAVFAAGLALRRVERRRMSENTNEKEPSVFVPGQKEVEVATDPNKAPAAMAEAVLHFNEQLERLGELTVVLLIGAMLSWAAIPCPCRMVRAFAAFLLYGRCPLQPDYSAPVSQHAKDTSRHGLGSVESALFTT